MWNVECGMWNVRMWNVGCEMLDVGFGMGHAARECSPTDRRSSLCRWAKIHLTYSCLPQSHRMKFDSIDHLFILEQQFWNILLVIEFPYIFFL